MASQLASRKILIVDDNVDSVDLIADLLSMYGHVTAKAYGGAGGIETAIDFQPDVMLVDLGMPEVTGYAVVKKLRQYPQMDDVVMVAYTAWDDATTRKQTSIAGFDEHLAKPADIERLLEVISLTRPKSPVI
ncbi:Response regulator receiver domain-containing protein [Duganella sacchari]|uniref:Response regulator receiver domain-containing protein n=1 Tax=Duganella sacchari TaxID=551987 RepID=A0A1M7PLS4_9BURK|nr:response regulator [Duganella sacchari]SHN18231.1 Response regulator receiver domain-containing protein [Duganella sacchari]